MSSTPATPNKDPLSVAKKYLSELPKASIGYEAEEIAKSIQDAFKEAGVEPDEGFKLLGTTNKDVYLSVAKKYLSELPKPSYSSEVKEIVKSIQDAFKEAGVEPDEGFRLLGTTNKDIYLNAAREYLSELPKASIGEEAEEIAKSIQVVFKEAGVEPDEGFELLGTTRNDVRVSVIKKYFEEKRVCEKLLPAAYDLNEVCRFLKEEGCSIDKESSTDTSMQALYKQVGLLFLEEVKRQRGRPSVLALSHAQNAFRKGGVEIKDVFNETGLRVRVSDDKMKVIACTYKPTNSILRAFRAAAIICKCVAIEIPKAMFLTAAELMERDNGFMAKAGAAAGFGLVGLGTNSVAKAIVGGIIGGVTLPVVLGGSVVLAIGGISALDSGVDRGIEEARDKGCLKLKYAPRFD